MAEGQEIPKPQVPKRTDIPSMVQKYKDERGHTDKAARDLVARDLVGLRQKARIEKLKDESIIDPLTGAYTKQYFKQQLDNAFGLIGREINPNPDGKVVRSKEEAHQVGVLMFDLDHFKGINDTHGHQEGDKVLKEFAETILYAKRKEDVFARLGGEEFGLLLMEVERLSPDYVARLAERFRDLVNHRVYAGSGDKIVPITVSIGMSLYPNGSPITTSDELMSYADQALYKAKEGGRNQVVKFVGVDSDGKPQFSRVDVSPKG